MDTCIQEEIEEKQMIPKERVLTALKHKEPDRVPLMYRDVPEVRERLFRDLNLKTDNELYEYFNIDFRWVGPEYIGPALEDDKTGHRFDIWGVEWKYTKFNKDSGYWNEVRHPLIDVHDPAALNDYSWPDISLWDFTSLAESADKFSGYAIMTAPGVSSPGLLQYPIQTLIGTERSFTDLYINPAFYRALMEKVENFQTLFVEKMMKAAGGRIDFFRMGDDYGSQNGLLLSPEIFKEFLSPSLKRIADIAKAHGAHYYHHTCGAVKTLIPTLIETGVEILDPVQIKAAEMVPADLKREFGSDICFSGGVDEQELLPNGTPAEIKAEVFKLLDTMAPGGGFFIGPTHNFQDDIPTENIAAMYEAAAEWKY